jgi:hypothetical protein
VCLFVLTGYLRITPISSKQKSVCKTYLLLTLISAAKDRSWFKTYKPFSSISHSIYRGQSWRVLGVGTIEIPTQPSPDRCAVASHDSLCLKEILQVPDLLCNILGDLDGDDYDVFLGNCLEPTTRGTIGSKQGRIVAYFDPTRPLFSVKVRGSGLPRGRRLRLSALEWDVPYLLNCRWDPAEQQKWQDFKTREIHSMSAQIFVSDGKPPYTTAEKAWLKKHRLTGFDFLRMYGLKMHNDGDRVEGRALVRGFMQDGLYDDLSDDEPGAKRFKAFHEGKEEEEEGEKEEEEEEEEENEPDTKVEQAKHKFSAAQLQWIDDTYGDIHDFMASQGLYLHDDNDIREAKMTIDYEIFWGE